jgi:hypothetical protein
MVEICLDPAVLIEIFQKCQTMQKLAGIYACSAKSSLNRSKAVQKIETNIL